ncbi:protein jag [Blautia liquoris]|uniref:RNA-binding protein KhpB n=1 Tax=Blautia liquoris TaxID=2779518 RepID=A0A7M2RJ83_9FIRM|nr:RNA-binding cell elongation regulator Jag/EloR [Blautia liquoris]QOV19412.1 protein jag [Blautia liquoris]
MDFVEVSAKTVDDAITKACIELKVSSDNLEIQVVSEGSSGFLGFGAKPAVIKARKKEDPILDLEDIKSVFEEKKEENKKNIKHEEINLDKREVKSSEEKKLESPGVQTTQRIKIPKTEEDIVVMKASAQKFLDSVFHSMDMDVDIEMSYDDMHECLNIDFSGDNMGILIGKRGQTLDSLQYLTGLVVNKDQETYVRVKLDTENYRKRRKETLENLARNIGYKVRKTKKAVSLEPMNPYERRIIHSALQGNKWVETYSEGKEPYRHVVIALKK